MNKLEEQKNKLLNYLPLELKEDFDKNAFIAGGAVYCYINNIDANDYDFFLKDEKFAKEIHEYFEHTEQLNNRKIIVTKNAITLKAPPEECKYDESGSCDWQIITKWAGNPLDVISEFDFKHNMLYWDDNEDEQIRPYGYDEKIRYYYKELSDTKLYHRKQLLFNDERARDISGVLLRLPKFLKRGFTISKKEHGKIIKKLLSIAKNRFTYQYKSMTLTELFDSPHSSQSLIDYNREEEILNSYIDY